MSSFIFDNSDFESSITLRSRFTPTRRPVIRRPLPRPKPKPIVRKPVLRSRIPPRRLVRRPLPKPKPRIVRRPAPKPISRPYKKCGKLCYSNGLKKCVVCGSTSRGATQARNTIAIRKSNYAKEVSYLKLLVRNKKYAEAARYYNALKRKYKKAGIIRTGGGLFAAMTPSTVSNLDADNLGRMLCGELGAQCPERLGGEISEKIAGGSVKGVSPVTDPRLQATNYAESFVGRITIS